MSYSIIEIIKELILLIDSIIDNLSVELKRGVQTIVVLNFLKEPQYGYSLLSELKDNNIDIEAGTLYPLLRRLEKQGILDATWDTEESRPRKFYVLNKTGEVVLDHLIKIWSDMQNNMENIIRGEINNE